MSVFLAVKERFALCWCLRAGLHLFPLSQQPPRELSQRGRRKRYDWSHWRPARAANRRYPISPKAHKYQLPSLPHGGPTKRRAHSCPSQNMASQHLQACRQMWPTVWPYWWPTCFHITWNASSQAAGDIMWPFNTEDDQDLCIYALVGHGRYLISCVACHISGRKLMTFTQCDRPWGKTTVMQRYYTHRLTTSKCYLMTRQ